MLRLCFTADDFGLSPGYSARILEHARAGRIQAVSAVVTGRPDPRLFAALADCPVRTGLHLNLSMGRPLCPSSLQTGLVDRCGSFLPPEIFLPRILRGLVDPGQIHDEIQAQIRCFRSLMPRLEHLDCHFHLQFVPSIFRQLQRIVHDASIPALRNPFRCWPLLPGFRPAIRDLAKLPFVLAGRLLGLQQQGPATADRVLGIYSLLPESLPLLLEPLKEHSHRLEIILHPEEDPDGLWNRWLTAGKADKLVQKLGAGLE